MQPKIGIIYVPYFDRGHWPVVVEAWANLNYPREQVEIFIVPNTNPDGILEDIEKTVAERAGQDLPRMTILNDGLNDGFAGNHNKGIRAALAAGCDFVYLNNGDAFMGPEALAAALRTMESDARIAAVQSLVMFWPEPETINAAGGVFHVAGHGYVAHNGDRLSDVKLTDGEDVSYPSGCAVLLRASALREVGLLEEGFFMYHEDLEFGLRFRIHGYRTVLSPDSKIFHDYKFSKNPKKFQWIETNRYIVVLAYYKWPTLLLLAPVLLGVDLASWLFALRGGWLRGKIYSTLTFLDPRTWLLILKIRARAKGLRRISDREFLRMVSGEIMAQEQHNWVVEKIANPLLNLYVRVLRLIVLW